MLTAATDMGKLKELSAKTYKEQGIWFLNAFWDKHADDAVAVFDFHQKMVELDEKSGSDGCELDELTAHRFLEQQQETLTVREMRDVLREIDIDSNKNVSLSEYLIYRYKSDWHHLVHAAQSDNTEELEHAQALLTDAQTKLGLARNLAQEASKAEREQRTAEAEQRKAHAALEAEEKAYEDRIADLEARTQTGGIVSRNKAANELAMAKNEDPLPLRRAKINQGATVRASEKATAAAVEKRAAADEAVANAQQAFEDAEAYLKEVSLKSGSGHGVVWWLQRELNEVKKYLPQSKGGGL